MGEDTININGEGHVPAEAGREVDFCNRHFLRFGGDANFAEGMLSIESARDYLASQGFFCGNLTHVRRQRGISARYRGYSAPGSHRCDFCGKAMSGVEYEVLRDGRERCMECSRTVVTGKQAFIKLFNEVKAEYCSKYGIAFSVPISVRITTAEQIAKKHRKTFVPTPGFDIRSVGLAIKEKGRYVIMLENEAPRMSVVQVLVHELTHIWQYANWDMSRIKSKYGTYEPVVSEGMAEWASVQFLYLIGEARHADNALDALMKRNDEYGFGLKTYVKQYPMASGVVLEGKTPFDDVDTPIEPALFARQG